MAELTRDPVSKPYVTDQHYDFAAGDSVQLLAGPRALTVLKTDLADLGDVYCWTFLIHDDFFAECMVPHLQHSHLYAICDHRQTTKARLLLSQHKRLRLRAWASNRTMHDKTILFPQASVTYLTTANFTRGSWSMAYNRVARIQSRRLTGRLADDFLLMFQRAKPLLPSDPS